MGSIGYGTLNYAVLVNNEDPGRHSVVHFTDDAAALTVVWRDNLGETAAAIGMGCGGRVRREGRRDSFRTQAIFDCR